MEFIKKHRFIILENAFSYVVVLAMLAYGVGKWVQFNGAAEIDLKISEMTGMQLMWAFYGYSRPFGLILGVLEITGGVLMLFRRTRLLGCFFVSTILVNVILQDIFYDVNVGALRAAILYQSLILIILFMNKDILIEIGKKLIEVKMNIGSWKSKFYVFLCSVVLFVILRILEYYVTIKW